MATCSPGLLFLSSDESIETRSLVILLDDDEWIGNIFAVFQRSKVLGRLPGAVTGERHTACACYIGGDSICEWRTIGLGERISDSVVP